MTTSTKRCDSLMRSTLFLLLSYRLHSLSSVIAWAGFYTERRNSKLVVGKGILKPYKTTEKRAGFFLSIPATSGADPDPGSSAFLIPGSNG